MLEYYNYILIMIDSRLYFGLRLCYELTCSACKVILLWLYNLDLDWLWLILGYILDLGYPMGLLIVPPQLRVL